MRIFFFPLFVFAIMLFAVKLFLEFGSPEKGILAEKRVVIREKALSEEGVDPPAVSLSVGIIDPSGTTTDVPLRIRAQREGTSSLRTNRYGDELIDGDLRLALLREGKAQRFPEEGGDALSLREAEREAMVHQRGLWAEDCCRVIAAEEAEKHTQEWRVVRGVVRGVKSYRSVTYVNFGDDWRRDFTVVVPIKLARVLHPETWQGQEIEVRGWIHWSNGAAIDLVAPEQVDFTRPSSPDSAPAMRQ